MKRSRVAGGAHLYDAQKDMDQLEKELAVIFYIAGLDFEQIEDVLVEQAFDAIKESFYYSSSSFVQHGKPYFDFLRKRNFHLTDSMREKMFLYNLAKYRRDNA